MFKGEMGPSSLYLRPNPPLPIDNRLDQVATIDRNTLITARKKYAPRAFSPTAIDFSTRNSVTEQEFVTLNSQELEYGIRQVLYLPQEFSFQKLFVDVPAAFTGRFAACLSSLGFTVRASDPVEEWVNTSRAKKLSAINCLGENLPRYPKGRFATITFEAYPLLDSLSAYLTLLRESINTQRGLVFVESRERGKGASTTRDDILFYKTSSRREILNSSTSTAVEAYSIMSRLYGMSVRIVDTPHLRFYAHDFSRTPLTKTSMKQDLCVLYGLRHILPKQQETSESLPFPVGAIAQKMSLSPEELIMSINRIERALQLVLIEPTLQENYGAVGAVRSMTVVPQSESERKFFRHRRLEDGSLVEESTFSQLKQIIQHWVR